MLRWLKSPKLTTRAPDSLGVGDMTDFVDRKALRDTKKHMNEIGIQRANFMLQKEALEHNLQIAHRSSLVAVAAAIIALAVGVATVIIGLHSHNVTVNVTSPKSVQVKH